MYSNLLKKSINWFKVNYLELLFPFAILIITFFIAYKSYTPNTFLTGWDNLHPEFNFKLNIVRSLNTAWQEYQGTGLLGGMSHAADLPRQIVLWIASFFLPISFLRYFWTFLMLFIGPLGVYFLVSKKSKLGGLTASIFYIFNLATVQYFFVPFETFIGFFGFLPWLIYFAIEYLNTGKKLWKYVLISIISTCAFYVQTLFLVYLIFLFLLSFKHFKRAIKLFLATFVVNAFWLLPVLWFSLTSSSIPVNSDINKIATPETILMNQARNDFSSISSHKGYWFDYYDFGENGQFDYLFKSWIDYSSKPFLSEIGIGLLVVSFFGLILNRQLIWLVLLGISYLMLTGFKIPVSMFMEAFRNSFTKWSVAFSFVISMGLGYFTASFKKIALIPAVLIICASVYSVWPILEGRLISERVKVSIPSAYFDSFDWANQTSNGGRIAYFPAFDKWGWNYHGWGYDGSGFIWYGIKNPILDRAFNVWSPNNENFYNEITRSILGNDQETFKKIIDKYQVSYLYLDDSIIFPGGDKELLKLDIILQFAQNLGYEKVFNKDFINIYDTHLKTNNFISALTSPDYDINLPLTVDEKTLLTGNKIIETFAPDHGFSEPYNCDLKKNGQVYRDRSHFSNVVLYRAVDGGVACDYFIFEDVKYDQAYTLRVKGENITGRSLKIYLYNWDTKRVELEELLPENKFDNYYIVYPKKKTGSGYTLNIETRSFGKIASENIIEAIEFIPFDLNKLKPETRTVLDSTLEIEEVGKFGTAVYKVKTRGEGILELGQGYENGWISYPKLEHTKVNNWANGFKINNDGIYYIFFWPQFLEWGGLVVLLLTLVYLIVQSRKNSLS